jgi:uncharacterized protein (DUF58 family)
VDEPEQAPDLGSIFSFTLIIALVSLIFFAAAAYSSATLAVFAGTTLTLMLAVRLWGRASLSRLAVSLSADRDRLFPAETLTLRADIVNGKLLPVWMRLELPGPEALTPIDGSAEGETGLLPYERLSGSWRFRAERRGVYRIGPAKIVAGDLLGLCRKEKELTFEREVTVFPRIVPIAELALPFRDYFGIHPSKGIIEDPAWYEGTREYSGLKPAKNIHWKASARLDVLQEKIFQPTSHRKVFFLLYGAGFREAEDADGFESALEIIASIAARFAETGASFAVAVDRAVRRYPAALPLGRGPEHLGKVLELLARCGIESGQPFAPLLGSVGFAGAGFIVVSRTPDERTKRFFSLPPSRRDRLLFLFSEDPGGAEEHGYPSVAFRRLRGDGDAGEEAAELTGEIER